MGGGGLSFLAKKYWHVTRPDNLERVWIAEKKKADEQKKALEREKQLREEQAQQTYLASLNTEDAERDRMKASLSFLYKAPPGLKELLEKEEKEKKELERAKKQEEERKLDERIKRMAMLKNEGPEERATRRQFERKQEEMLSHAERESKRFDFLKDAPTMGEYTKNVKLKHKPLGILVREVRCVRCGVWGHLTGDRECKLRDVNPNDHSRQAREDPLAAMKKLEEDDQSSSTKKKKKGKGKGRKYKDEKSRSRSRGRGKKHHQSSSSSSRNHRHPRSWSRSVSRSRSPPPGVKRHFNSKRGYERRHERRYERRHERNSRSRSRSRSRSPVMKSSRRNQKNRKNDENKTKQDLIEERRARQHEDEQNEPAQFDPSAIANQTDEDRNLKLIFPKGSGSVARGGFDANDPNQQLLSEPEDEEPSSESDDEDLKYIQSLSLDEKMMLLKSMKKLQKAEKKRKRKKKEKKKRKKEKKRKRKEEGGKSKKKSKR